MSFGLLWQCRVTWRQPDAQCGKPRATLQSMEGSGLQYSLSYLAQVRTPILFFHTQGREEGCPEKAQQGPGLGPGSEPTSKRIHDPPALAEETTGCQKTSGRPCGSRPIVGLVGTLLPRSGPQSWAVHDHALRKFDILLRPLSYRPRTPTGCLSSMLSSR